MWKDRAKECMYETGLCGEECAVYCDLGVRIFYLTTLLYSRKKNTRY